VSDLKLTSRRSSRISIILYWDTNVVPHNKCALCKHCNKTVSVASSTNMRSHLAAKHRDVIVQELAVDESLDPSNIQTPKSLKADFNSVEKFKDCLKKSTNEQYVKMCCKNQRALSIGESDRELKSWVLRASRGRYVNYVYRTYLLYLKSNCKFFTLFTIFFTHLDRFWIPIRMGGLLGGCSRLGLDEYISLVQFLSLRALSM